MVKGQDGVGISTARKGEMAIIVVPASHSDQNSMQATPYSYTKLSHFFLSSRPDQITLVCIALKFMK